MRYLSVLLVMLFALQPALAPARPGGGGGGAMRGGGGGMRGGGGGGFNLGSDARPQGGNRGNVGNGNRGNGNVNNGNRNNGNVNNGNRNNGNVNNGNRNNGNVNNGNVNRNNFNNNNINNNTVNRNVNNVNVSGNTVIRNPTYVNTTAWGWNHGVVWAPAPYYWGGGFWGAMAIGVTSAAVYGSIVANNVTYTSYQVAPSSPGATFLSSYHLTQVQCGPAGLVVVYGPQNSVICANPNNLVAAGTYQLNTETLTLSAM